MPKILANSPSIVPENSGGLQPHRTIELTLDELFVLIANDPALVINHRIVSPAQHGAAYLSTNPDESTSSLWDEVNDALFSE